MSFEDNSIMETKGNERDSLNDGQSTHQDEEKQYDEEKSHMISNNSTTSILHQNIGEHELSCSLADVEIS